MELHILKKMEVKPLLGLPEGLEVTGIDLIDEVLTNTVVSTTDVPLLPALWCTGFARP